MGQKINPHGFRVGVIKDWDSRWYVKDEEFGDTLVSDYNVRKFLKNEFKNAGVPKIEIERTSRSVKITIHCAKPGMVIGRGGSEKEKYKAILEKMLNKPVRLDIVEVRQPDLDAQLVAENIAAQLERRISFRRAMKMAIRNTMRLGAKGIRIKCGGRLGGAEIARSEHYHEGTIPLQTLRADIDYGLAEAATTYGRIGIKVWIYRGEVLSDVNRQGYNPRERRDNREGGRDNRRPPRDGGSGNFRGDRKPGEGRPYYPRTNTGSTDNRAPRNDAPRNYTPRDGAARTDAPRTDRTPTEGGKK